MHPGPAVLWAVGSVHEAEGRDYRVCGNTVAITQARIVLEPRRPHFSEPFSGLNHTDQQTVH